MHTASAAEAYDWVEMWVCGCGYGRGVEGGGLISCSLLGIMIHCPLTCSTCTCTLQVLQRPMIGWRCAPRGCERVGVGGWERGDGGSQAHAWQSAVVVSKSV